MVWWVGDLCDSGKGVLGEDFVGERRLIFSTAKALLGGGRGGFNT